jgi:hypothetical protein
MSARTRAALLRFGRAVAAGALAAVITGLPVLVTDLVPASYLIVAQPLVAAALLGLDKARRFIADED